MQEPDPNRPKVIFAISGSLSADGTTNVPVAWTVGQLHPILPTYSVLGIFVDPDGIEIYSVEPQKQIGIRNFIPMNWVRFVQESMPLEVFKDELEAAMNGDDDDDDDPGEIFDDPNDPNPPVPPTAVIGPGAAS